ATGRIAAGWTNVSGTWQVVAHATAPSKPNVLAQVSSEHTGSYFNIAIADQPLLKDLSIGVLSRAVAGREEQGGGVVWRYRDPKNYYVAWQDNLKVVYRVDKVLEGKRIQLGSAPVSAEKGTWHELTITMIGDHIQCLLDAKKRLDVRDSSFS